MGFEKTQVYGSILPGDKHNVKTINKKIVRKEFTACFRLRSSSYDPTSRLRRGARKESLFCFSLRGGKTKRTLSPDYDDVVTSGS